MTQDGQADESDVDAVLAARQSDPFAVLGLHETPEGWAIRAFVPLPWTQSRSATSTSFSCWPLNNDHLVAAWMPAGASTPSRPRFATFNLAETMCVYCSRTDRRNAD
jgi:hypothetical protein